MNERDTNHCTVRFYHGAVLNQAKSEAAGRRIFDDMEMVEVKYPGDITRSNVAPAHDKCFMYRPRPGEVDDGRGFLTWAEQFEEQYKRFKANDPAADRSGTPLEHAPFLTPAKVFELRAQNIHTVEALAGISPSIAQKNHWQGLVAQAVTLLDTAQATAEVAKATAEKQALEDKFAALQAEIEALKAGKSNDPATWSDDQLRAFLTERGAKPRANAARDTLIVAVREMQEMA